MDKLNKTAHKFGGQLINQGIWWQRKAFKPKKAKLDQATLRRLLEGQIGKQGFTSLYDKQYYATSLENWKTIIKNDLVDLEKYQYDFRDCDNFSFSFASNASMIYGLNTCLVCTGGCYDRNGKLIRHAFNIFVVNNNGIFYLYVLEPQTDTFALLKKEGTKLTSPKWTYNIDWCIAY